MIEPAFESGITLVAGPEQIPLDRVLGGVCGRGRPVLVVARGAPAARWGAEVTWMAEPAIPAEIAAWVDQGQPCVLVVEGARCLGGWLAAERAEARLVRLLDLLRPGANATVVLIESLPPLRVRAPDGAAARLLQRVDRTFLWTGAVLVRAREALAPTVHRRKDLPWDTFVSEAWIWLGVALLCALASAGVALAAGARGQTLLGSARDVLPRSLWVDAWFSHQVATGGSWTHADTVAWPLGTDVISHVGGLAAAVMALPLVRALGYPGFWNPAVCMALTANGLAAGWLARVTGADRAGVALAALAFTVAPPVLAAVGLGDQAVFWAAPMVVAIVLGLRALDGDRKDAVIAGIGVGVAGLFWWFYALFAVFLVGALGLARALQDPPGRPALGQRLGLAVRATLPFSIALFPMVGAWVRADWPRVESLASGGLGTATGSAMASFHRTTTDVLPLDQLFAFPGAGWGCVSAALVIAIGGTWLVFNRGRRVFWTAVAAVSAVLALGPWLDPRWGLASGWLPLPLRALQVLFPPLELLDRPSRLLILTALATSVQGASLWRPLRARIFPELRPLVWGAALVLIGGASAATAKIPTFSFQVPAWVHALDQDGAVLHVPMGLSEADLMWQPLHGQPIAGGPDEVALMGEGTPYRLAFEVNPALAFFWSFSNGELDPGGRAWLIAHGARYVVVYQEIVNRISSGSAEGVYLLPLADRVEQALGPAIYDGHDVRVYRIDPATP